MRKDRKEKDPTDKFLDSMVKAKDVQKIYPP